MFSFLVKISTFSTLTPSKTSNSGPKKQVIADFQKEFHGVAGKKLIFCSRRLRKIGKKTTLKQLKATNQTDKIFVCRQN